jgi:Tfp pilus assembly protein PilE
MMSKFCNRLKGFGLLEVMLVIAVTAIVIFLSTSYYASIRHQTKINQTMNQIHGLVQGANAYLQAQANTNLATITGSDHELSATLAQGAYIANADIINPWAPSTPYTIYIVLPSTLQINVKGLDNTSCNTIQAKLQADMPTATCIHGTKTRMAILTIPL